MEERRKAKIVFPLDEGPAETMWADHLGNALYKIDNIPWFAYGVSLDDVISVRYVEGDPRPYFDHVVVPSGKVTYRVTFTESLPREARTEANALLENIKELAEASSRYSDDYVAIVASATAARSGIERLLDIGESSGFWDWETSTAA